MASESKEGIGLRKKVLTPLKDAPPVAAPGSPDTPGIDHTRSAQRETVTATKRIRTDGEAVVTNPKVVEKRRSRSEFPELTKAPLPDVGGGAATAGDDDGGSDDEEIILEWTNKVTGEVAPLNADHCKLLYMMSKYARCAMSSTESESWIRQMPLLVLTYEGILAGALDFDYAPCSRVVSAQGSSQRIWVNITQEGKAAIDDLREWKLINGLKLSTEDFQPVTAFQVSLEGMAALKSIPKYLCNEVDDFIYAVPSKPSHANLKQVTFVKGDTGGDGEFFLRTDNGYNELSTITDTEDVSYVSSPFLPSCLRATDRPATNNAHRAHESAAGSSDIRDELSVAVELKNVRAMVGEWIPFGSNQIVALNERLGAMDRCQGGLFTAMVDSSPTDTNFEVDAGLTSVKILDFDIVRFINFEAEIMYPEEEGVVQVENFGMHLNVDGTIIYGLFVEAILDMTAECTCVDHLARVLVDVHQDSSRIMNDLLSPYQRALLQMIFCGDMMARNKYNMLVADMMTPLLPAGSYMDRSERETELKQVLGDIDNVYDLGPEDRLIMGREGCLIAGPEAPKRELLITSYISLLTKELMIRNFFNRTFVLDDELTRIRKLSQTYHTSPFKVDAMRTMLQDSTRNLILMQETLGYIHESLTMASIPKTDVSDPVGRQLKKRLALRTMSHDVMLRVKDLFKLMDGAANKVKIMQLQSTAIDKRTLEDTVKSIDTNYTALVAASAAEQRSSASIEVMNIIFSGSFAFDIVDRLSGDDILGAVGVDDGRGLRWLTVAIKDALVKYPFLWFMVNMLWLLIVGLSLQKLMRYLIAKGLGALSLRAIINRRVWVPRLERFLAEVKIDSIGYVADTEAAIVKAVWYDSDPERWGGATMKLDILYNQSTGFLLQVLFGWNLHETKMRNKEVRQAFLDMLEAKGLFDNRSEEEVAEALAAAAASN